MSHVPPDRSFSCLVVVPVYNAAEHLPELIRRMRQYVCNENMLFVNDGSSDDSLEIIRRENLSHITYPENRGKGIALRAAFSFAVSQGYRSVITIDSDLQHQPEELPRLFARDDGTRIVIGTRDLNFRIMPTARCASNNLLSLVISVLSAQRIRDSQSGYRLIPTAVLRKIPLSATRYDIETELILKAGALGIRIEEIPVSTIYAGSKSYINPYRDTQRFTQQLWRRIWG